jgi:SAM-dependent methyltransferase
MRAEDFEYLYKLEENFWWFVAMRDITDTIVGADLQGQHLNVLDAGSGTGYNLLHYENQGQRVFSFDISADALAAVRDRGFQKICQASVTEIPYRSEAFDVVFSFDVVQQLSAEDGKKAIREMQRVLKPGGRLFIRVAAFEWMRSSHDEEMDTLHRYTRSELTEILKSAGFEVQLASYANTFLFPVVLLKRSLKRLGIGAGSDVKPLPSGLGWIDPIFRRVLGAEASFLRNRITFPLGLSVVAYAKKTGLGVSR